MMRQPKVSTEERRTLILDTTEALLVEVGNGALTMRKIAAAAEISLGNLQYHFATREDVLLALLMRFLEPYEARFQNPPTDMPEDVVEALKPMFLEVLSIPDFDRCATIYKEIWAASSHSPEMRKTLNSYYKRLFAFYREVLACVAGNKTEPLKIERAVAALMPTLEGYCITRDAVDVPVETIAEDWAKMATALLR